MFLAESSVIRVCEIVVPLHLQSSGAHGDPLHKAERVRRDARASPRCIRANALYEGRYLLGTAMARPCIAKRQVRPRAPARPLWVPRARARRRWRTTLVVGGGEELI